MSEMKNQFYETPLVETLREVPINHRTEWETTWLDDGTPIRHRSSVIGLTCHKAADRIEALDAAIATSCDDQRSEILGGCDRANTAETTVKKLQAQLDKVRELPRFNITMDHESIYFGCYEVDFNGDFIDAAELQQILKGEGNE